MHKLRMKIDEFDKKYGLHKLADRTGIEIRTLAHLINNTRGKYRRQTIDILYDYFQLEKDEWYKENTKKWIKPTESILGDIFRKKRIKIGMSIDQVAKKIKMDGRQIARIEAGDSLPSYRGYAVSNLLTIYDFNPEECEKIRWYICILRDIVNINNRLHDNDIVKDDKMPIDIDGISI